MLKPFRAIGAAALSLVCADVARAEFFTVTCPPNPREPQVCLTRVAFSFQSDGPHVRYGLELHAPATHCSRVTYRIYGTFIDPPAFIARTSGPGLAAGEVHIVRLDVAFPKGNARVLIEALGHDGGCNTGKIESWGVNVNAKVLPR